MNMLETRSRYPVVTVALIAISVVVSLLANFSLVMPLIIGLPGRPLFSDVLGGEVWRLVTPMFLHLSFLHILFNMMWLWDLGRLVEMIKGSVFLLAFVVVTGAASNVAQYAITGSPAFGGMSGVVYALLGYVWMQGKFNPRFGFEMHKATVIMMLVWYVLCWTGLVGPIANWAHTGGLVLGVAWGYLAAHRGRRW
jgi:membrane associated rhomboid family serine protease